MASCVFDYCIRVQEGNTQGDTNACKPAKQSLGNGIHSRCRQILWVDDHQMRNLDEIAKLKNWGARVISVDSTKSAITVLDRNDIDLIISDILRIENGVENHNAGYELLQIVKERDRWRDIPVIFYTGEVQHVDKSKSKGVYGIADRPRTLLGLIYLALTDNLAER